MYVCSLSFISCFEFSIPLSQQRDYRPSQTRVRLKALISGYFSSFHAQFSDLYFCCQDKNCTLTDPPRARENGSHQASIRHKPSDTTYDTCFTPSDPAAAGRAREHRARTASTSTQSEDSLLPYRTRSEIEDVALRACPQAAVRARPSFSERVCSSEFENTALSKLRLRHKPQTTFRRKRSVLESIALLLGTDGRQL